MKKTVTLAILTVCGLLSTAWAQLAAPTLSSPANNLTDAYVRQTLQWTRITAATGYTIQIDTSADFNSPSLQSFSQAGATSSTQSRTVYALHYGTTYHWRIRSYNGVDTSGWSAVRTLTTTDYVALYTPANNNTGASISLSLYWYNSVGSSAYTIEIDTSRHFSSPMLQSVSVAKDSTSTTSHFYHVCSNLRYGTTYYWRVRSSNGTDTSGWSAVRRFTTTYNNVAGPTLTAPGNDTAGVPHNATLLSWQALGDMTGYRYHVSTNASFTDTVAMAITSLTFTSLTTLYPSTTYYWRVQGLYATGMTNYSNAWHFTTADVPLTAPTPVAPANLSNVQQSSVTLSWQSTYGALRYQLQFSLDSTFQVGVAAYTTDNAAFTLNGLQTDMTYYWRVRAANDHAYSEWSATWNFNTNTCTPSAATLTAGICEGNSYWFFGTPLATSGTYTHVLPNATGCDSTVTLLLTVHPRGLDGSVTDTACDSYVWNGLTYIASGHYPYYTQTTHGCDSIAVLHLTLFHSAATDTTATACDSILWHGDSYTASGNHPYHTLTLHGCDSLEVLHLTVHYSDTAELYNDSTCDSYVWNDMYLPEDGDYYNYGTNSHGCRHTTILHLTLLHSTSGTDEQESCDSLTWMDGNTYYASTADSITYVVANAAGCDSTITLHLTLHHSAYTDLYDTATGPYLWHGEEYAESGDYRRWYATLEGCDSIVTLHLVVLHDTTGIHTPALHDITVTALSGKIMVTGAAGLPLRLYDMAGRTVATIPHAAEEQPLTPPCAGSYLLRIGNCTAQKVVVVR